MIWKYQNNFSVHKKTFWPHTFKWPGVNNPNNYKTSFDLPTDHSGARNPPRSLHLWRSTSFFISQRNKQNLFIIFALFLHPFPIKFQLWFKQLSIGVWLQRAWVACKLLIFADKTNVPSKVPNFHLCVPSHVKICNVNVQKRFELIKPKLNCRIEIWRARNWVIKVEGVGEIILTTL